jgi:hypothetical protein
MCLVRRVVSLVGKGFGPEYNYCALRFSLLSDFAILTQE